MGTSVEASAAGVESPETKDTMDRRDTEEMRDELAFQAQDIAEQLTLLDAVSVKFCTLRLVFIFGLLLFICFHFFLRNSLSKWFRFTALDAFGLKGTRKRTGI